MKKEKLKRIARRITAFAAAAAMAATLTFPTGTELLGINFGTSVVASAETMTDGNFDYTINESTVTITKYNGSGGEVEIPATIGGNTVTSIGAEAFKDCTSLTSVAIPEGVSSIGAEAFFGCSSLRSITIPDSVTSIGEYAFYSCTSLESINIPDSVTKIDRYTFTNCTSLSVITIPKTVTSISSSAFTACSGLSSINVAEENTKYISDDGVLFNNNKTELLFYPANKDSTSYAIPDGVTTIESYAFYENNNLVSITIPDGVTNIGASAFDSCKKLTSVSIPASVNNIGSEAFNSCESLTAISVHENNSEYSSEDGVLFDKNKTILFVYPAEKSEKSYTVPNTVKHIFMNSFAGCVNLENITLNEGVENIDLAAFMGCTNLKSINIPSSVTAIGDRAFMLCTSLTEISVHSDNSNYSSEDGVLFDKNKTKLIVYPGGKSDTSYSVPSSVTSVYNMAFLMCPNLESIAFPPSVTSFGYSVIIGCEKLASVFVPEKATFTNQIDPAEMFTSEVRYAVSDDKANITGIELGTGQTTVDIPETICGYTVASVLPSQWAKVGKHTHKWDGTNTCGLCGVNRSSRFDITIKEPSAGKALATQASVICNTTKENCDIIWEPAPTDGIAAYGTAYTASVTISSGSTPVVTINGEAVDSSNITANVDGTFTVKHTFDATEKRTLTASDFSFAAPSDLVYNGSAKEAAFTTAVSGAGDITVKYYDDNGTKLDSAPVNAGTYTVKIDVAAGAECAAANELTDSTWTFTIKRAAVTVTAKDYKVKLGDSLPAKLEYETDGLIGTDTLASIGANVTIGYANAGTPSAIGNYTIVVSGAENTTNYELTYVNGKLTIIAEKAQEITAADVTLTYGDAGKKIGAATSGDGAITYAVKTGEDVISTAADGTITALKAGTATVEITAAETDDYAKATKTITVTVNKATPTDATTASQSFTKGTASTAFAAPVFKGIDSEKLTGSLSYTYGGQTYTTTAALTAALDLLDGGTTGTISYTFTPTSANYTTASGSITFSVIDAVVTGITLKSAPTKTTYEIGDTLDLTGGQITVSYNNGTSVDIDITAEMISGFDSTTAGEKTVTVTYSGFTATFKVTLSKGSFTVEPDPGNIEGAEIDMPEEELNDAVLTPEDKVLIEQGVDIAVLMTVITINPETVPANDVTAIENVMNDFDLGCYIDVELFKRYSNGNPDVPVTDTNAPITISFKVPADILTQYPVSDYEYSVFCSHNGVGYPITCSYNAATNVMSFSSTMFSTYALAVKSRTPAAVDYTITADSHVTVQSTAQAGDIVSVTVEDGYKATVTDSLGTVIATITGTGSFVMPESNVTITSELINTHVHDYSTEWNMDSTSHWHECTCGDKTDIESHTEDSGTVTTEPTETTEGVRTYKCVKCEYVMRTETIPPITPEHTHEYSTEWKSDSTSHWHECSCGDKSNIGQHISNGGIVTVQPTATSTGLRVYSCSVCGYVLRTETIPATGYNYPNYPTYPTYPTYPFDSSIFNVVTFTDKVNVTAETEGNTITIKWDKVEKADKYYVYQYKNGKYVKVKTTSDTSATFKNLKNGETYKFLIRYTKSGRLSPTKYSGTISVKVYYKPIPKPTATKNSIKLTWEAIPEAEKYAVYKYVDGKAVKLTETKKLSVKIGKLIPDTEYKYIVRAYVDGKWTTMLKSDIVTVKTKAE